MNQTELAYLPIAELRKMSTQEIRQVQLEVNAILENQGTYAQCLQRRI